MTKSKPDLSGADESARRCRWCRHALGPQDGPGRPRLYCRQSCRQWDWVMRQRAHDLDLSENELIIARDELDELKDRLYVLHCALEDARRDLSAGPQTKDGLVEILEWVMSAAEPVTTGTFAKPT